MKTITLTPRLFGILSEAVRAEADNVADTDKEDRPVPLDSVERVVTALANAKDGVFQIDDGDLFTLQGCWTVGSEGAGCTDEEWQQITNAIA